MIVLCRADVRCGSDKRRLVHGDQTLSDVIFWAKDRCGDDAEILSVELEEVDVKAPHDMIGRIVQPGTPAGPMLVWVGTRDGNVWTREVGTYFLPRTWTLEEVYAATKGLVTIHFCTVETQAHP